MRLKRDIYSYFNNKIKYGNAGDEVKLVSEVIVEGPDGNRYTVKGADLEDTPVKIEDSDDKKPKADKKAPAPVKNITKKVTIRNTTPRNTTPRNTTPKTQNSQPSLF
jgi:hypothetical protein